MWAFFWSQKWALSLGTKRPPPPSGTRAQNSTSVPIGLKGRIFKFSKDQVRGLAGPEASRPAGGWLHSFEAGSFILLYVKCAKITMFTETGCKICRVCLKMWFSLHLKSILMSVVIVPHKTMLSKSTIKLHCSLREVVRFTGFVSKCNFHSIWTGFLVL